MTMDALLTGAPDSSLKPTQWRPTHKKKAFDVTDTVLECRLGRDSKGWQKKETERPPVFVSLVNYDLMSLSLFCSLGANCAAFIG